jgi:acetyl esterase/lipase
MLIMHMGTRIFPSVFIPGGFVIGSNASYDPYLTKLSNHLGLIMVSVEYRLAPEHKFPTFLNDCVDAALYALSPEGEQTLGAQLKIIGGESAGGWLAVSTVLSLRRAHNVDVRSAISAIVTGYGVYDATYTPSMLQHTRNIVVGSQGMKDFCEAAFGEIPMADRKHASISPLYADLTGLPPALFLTGNIEPLIDDSVFMATKYLEAGNSCELVVVNGACHAFTIIEMGDTTAEGISVVVDFVRRKLSVS